MKLLYIIFLTKLKSTRGAMDKILVTLLLVVVAVASLVAIESWFSNKKDELVNTSNTSITNVTNNT